MNTAHPRPWGWRVTTYLWTKGVGGGALIVAALAVLLGVDLGALAAIVAPALAMAGAAATGGLLVWDLKRPERFLYLLTKPNFRSWLVLGVVALAAFAAVSGVWLLLGIGGRDRPDRLAANARSRSWPGSRCPPASWWRATPRSCSTRPRAATCGSRRCCSGT